MKRLAFILVIIYLALVVLTNQLANSQEVPKIGDIVDAGKCPKYAICSCIRWSHVPEFHCTKEKIIGWKLVS